MPMKKPEQSATGAAGANPEGCGLAIRLPSLWEFLVEQTWDDGTKRTPGTFMMFVEDGWFKTMLNDKDGQRIAFCAGDTLSAALEAADLGLREGKLDWRKSKPFRGGRGG